MKYIGIAFLIGIATGAIHNIILFRHVLPYMKRRGFEPKSSFAAFQLNQAVAEYYRTDDPSEKKTKILLRCLKIPFVGAMLIAAFGIYAIWKRSQGG